LLGSQPGHLELDFLSPFGSLFRKLLFILSSYLLDAFFVLGLEGLLKGFQVRGGAASVGEATTAAVVSSIFLIIVADSLFAVNLRYW